MIGELLDKAIAPLFPTLAARRALGRAQYRALATYNAAQRSRKNKDWQPKREISADLAIIPDLDLMIARSRDLIRDNWVAKSILNAFARNVVGCGVFPSAAAKGEDGSELRDFNELRDRLFMKWASNKAHCDIERKQTYWRKQKMAINEMVAVGEHFIVWSYIPNPETVGLRLQSFKPEQLDKIRIRNEANGNEIRRGIEIDDNGAPIAYWFLRRPFNDYGCLPSTLEPIRIDAGNVLHIFDPDRSRQTHGVPWIAPVMQKIRDVQGFDDATLMKARVESMVSLMINRDGGARPGAPGGLPGGRPGFSEDVGAGSTADTDDLPSKKRYNFENMMIFEGGLNEKVSAVQPATPSANYDPFMRMNLRGCSAAVDLSYDVVARDYDQGSYTSKRQGLLEDRRAYAPVTDLLTDEVCDPVTRLFVMFAVLENRFAFLKGPSAVTTTEYFSDPDRYNATEHVGDGFEWVDPKKEADAAAVALDRRLMTRKELLGRRGRNWRNEFQQIADEQKEAKRLGLTLPENALDAPGTAPAVEGGAGEGDDVTPN